MIIRLNGHDIALHPSGVALWRAQGIAIVADLHLEKGSHFARRGYFLPPYDSHETLERLLALCAAQQVRQLVILGDCFHDAGGYERLNAAEKHAFARLLALDAIWIQGNHDGDFVPEGLRAYEEYVLTGITFRHIAKAHSTGGEVSGHFHPKMKIAHKESRLERRCFVEDGMKLMLPAFGAYAGGLDAGNPAIRSLFSTAPRFHVLGESRIYSLREATGS